MNLESNLIKESYFPVNSHYGYTMESLQNDLLLRAARGEQVERVQPTDANAAPVMSACEKLSKQLASKSSTK